MGDNAEFEKLTMLEARLAAALDRIAVGLGEAQAMARIEDPAFTSGALEDMQMRVEAAEARAAALEAELGAGRDAAAAQASLIAERDAALQRAAALEAAREADRDEAQRALAAREAELATLRAAAQSEISAADAPTEVPSEAEATAALEAQLAELQGRVGRLRAERAEALAQRDEARDLLEEMQASTGVTPDDRVMALRAEVQELRVINERLAKNLDRMRSANASDPRLLNKALVVELDALKAIRASEAAELSRILSDLEGGATGEGGHA